MTTPVFARGVAKVPSIAPETSFGTPGTGPGQQLRRTGIDLNLSVTEIQSAEILPSQQMRDHRNGPRQVQGQISGQLSPATYRLLFENLLRNTSVPYPAASLGPLTDSAATVTGANLLVTSSMTDFTQSFKLGDVVRLGNLSAGAAPDNAMNVRVVGIQAHALALASIVGGQGWSASSQSSDVILAPGKRLVIPAAGQLDQSFTLEQWYADIAYSETFTGLKVTQISLSIPASGFVTFQASVTGQNLIEGTTQRYSGAAAPTASTGLTAVSGAISYNATTLAYITGMSLQIASQTDAPNVVGSNVIPAIFNGTMMVRGSFTALMTGDTMTTDFLQENEVQLGMLMTASPAGNADFINVYMPRVKLTASTKTDSDRAITRSFNFVALENTANLFADLSTILIQDSTI